MSFIPNAWNIAKKAIADLLSAEVAISNSTALGTGLKVNADFPIETHSQYAALIDSYTHNNAGFRAPYLNFYKSRGTQASPTAVTLTGYEQDSIGGINFGGYDGTAYVVGCGIYSQVSHSWDANSHGAFLSIYGTAMADGSDPRQIIQFGGLDATDLVSGTGSIDTNIIAYAPISFGGNKSANPCFSYVLGVLGTPAKIQLKLADDSGFASFEVGQFFCNPGSSVTPTTNGQLTVQASSNTQIVFKLKGSDGVVRSSAPITLS